jgi:hypothetical protein
VVSNLCLCVSMVPALPGGALDEPAAQASQVAGQAGRQRVSPEGRGTLQAKLSISLPARGPWGTGTTVPLNTPRV